MEVSCSAAFSHINTYISPQATFIDVSGEEDPYLLVGLKDRAKSLGRTIIEMPENAEQNFMWTTLLDSASLSCKLASSKEAIKTNPLGSLGQSQH